MNHPIILTLENLIPRHSGALPRELIDLASSLLAQSRSKISNLRSDEEIARTYACANIACERLKTTLNLPKIEPRPPVPPKVYSKLYAHFDKTLVSTSESRKRARQEERVEEKRKLPERHAPSQEKSLDGFRANRAPKRGLRFGGMSKDSKLPKWVGPAIRVVCRELNAGKAVPHVYAGVETVLYMPCPLGEDGRLKGKMPALLAGIFFYVSIRMNGTEATQERFNEERKQVLGILRALKGNEEFAGKIGAEEADWEGWEVVSRKDVDAYIKELSDKGWLKLEWYENLVDGMGAAGEVAELVEEEDLEADEEVEREKKRKREWGQNIGRGTMKQPQFDYLSEEKRRAHAEWQAAMLAIIDKQIAKGILHGDQQMTEG